jgi:hemoglobin/transferrin/lactoferrin receptor protein
MNVAAFLILVFSLVSTVIFAQDADSVYHLDEIVVSANRWEQNLADVPNKVATISSSTIRFQNPQTAADLLGLSNSVFIQKSQLGGGSPMIRGFATNRVLIVVDGIRMNNAIFRAGNVQNVISIDANAVDESEIIFGPGSVMYGSDAIGGVMDFHTIKPEFSGSNAARSSINGLIRYSSANNENSGHFDFKIGSQKLAFLSSVSYSDFGDLRMGSDGPEDYLRNDYVIRRSDQDLVVINNHPNIQKHSGYSQLNALHKIAFKARNDFLATYAFNYSVTSDYPRYDRLSLKNDAGNFTNAEWYYGPQRWAMHSLNLTSSKMRALFDQLQLIAGYQHYEESRHTRSVGSLNRTDREENVKAFSLNLDFDKSCSDKFDLFYGAEYITNKVYSAAGRINIGNGQTSAASTRYPDDSDWRTGAIYASGRMRWSEKVLTSLSARFTNVYSHAFFDKTTFDFPFTESSISSNSVNGSLGVIVKPSENWKLYTNLSSAFRAPNIDDIGKVFDSQPGNVVIPNPELEPEKAYSAELGFASVILQKLKIDLASYYSVITNAITRGTSTFNGQEYIMYDDALSRVYSQQNIGDVTVYGIQLGADYALTNEFRVTSSYNYQRGAEKDIVSGKYLSPAHVAPSFGSTHVRYCKNKITADLYANYNGAKDIKDVVITEQADRNLYARDENGDPYSPAWCTLNFKTQYSLEHYQFSAGVENIFDKRYRPYASGISAPGINLIISIRANF